MGRLSEIGRGSSVEDAVEETEMGRGDAAGDCRWNWSKNPRRSRRIAVGADRMCAVGIVGKAGSRFTIAASAPESGPEWGWGGGEGEICAAIYRRRIIIR